MLFYVKGERILKMRKENFIEQYKQVLMTNYVASTSISLQSIYEEMKKEIELSSTWSMNEKNIFLQNLLDAHHQIKNEISGKLEE